MRASRSWPLSLLLLGVGFLLPSCKPRGDLSDPTADDYQRFVLGQGAPWAGIGHDSAEQHELIADLRKNREMGWRIIHRAFQPYELATSVAEKKQVPAWLTWYTAVEVEKLFTDLFLALPPGQRLKDQGPISEDLVGCVMNHYSTEERLKEWEGSRFDMRRIEQLQAGDPHALNNMAKQVTYFSPAYVKHYLRNFTKVVACRDLKDLDQAPSSAQEKFACFHEPFPADAVAIKAAWMHPELAIDYYDTSAAGLKASLEGSAWSKQCLVHDGKQTCEIAASAPALDGRIFSADVPHPDGTDHRFRLVGLHIATKQLPEWTWTTMWWSPSPNGDFGDDRPDYLGKYGGSSMPELQHYKMCHVVHWQQRDEGILKAIRASKLPESQQDLTSAIAAAARYGSGNIEQDADGDYALTYCANPFIEKEQEMIDSNCIGCHQAAKPGGDMEFSRAQQVRRFPSDYSWAFTSAGTSFSTDDNFQRRFANIYRTYARDPQVPCP